jgi:hypothetical protein
MNGIALSKAIHDATAFLEQVHEDVRSLLTTLVERMEHHGWHEAYNGRVNWGLSPKLDGDWYWVLPDAWLLFLPREPSIRLSERFIAISCNFTHPKGADHGYATFAASVTRLQKKVPVDEIWDEWEPNPEVYAACLGQDEFVSLSLDKFCGSSRYTANVATLIFPLSDLTDPDVLQTKVIGPLLEVEKKLGAKK